MRFSDRIALGKSFADKVSDLRSKDAIVVCLKESSLLTCVSLAIELKAWLYPLLSSPVRSPLPGNRRLGAYDASGTFCLDPSLGVERVAELPTTERESIESQKYTAAGRIKHQTDRYEIALDRERLHSRHIVLAADVVTEELTISLALSLLASIRPKSVTTIIGNCTPAVANLVRLTAERTVISDVISGPIADDNRYFDELDHYSILQKQQIAKHIASYWH